MLCRYPDPLSPSVLEGFYPDYIPAGHQFSFNNFSQASLASRENNSGKIWCLLTYKNSDGQTRKGWVNAYYLALSDGTPLACGTIRIELADSECHIYLRAPSMRAAANEAEYDEVALAPRQLGDRTARGRMNTCADGTADKMIWCLFSIFAVLLLELRLRARKSPFRAWATATLSSCLELIKGDDSTFDWLTKLITNSSHTLVLLDSSGGYVLLAVQIGSLVYERVFSTINNVQLGGDALFCPLI